MGKINLGITDLYKPAKGYEEGQVGIPNVNLMPKNATYGVDPVTDKMLESQYVDESDNLHKTYIEKVGLETGLTADIQNTDKKILTNMIMLEAPSDDIFNNPDLSSEEKVAMFNQRRNVAQNRTIQLRRLQSAKIKELNDIAKVEADTARAKQAELKSILELNKNTFEREKWQKEFNLKVGKANFEIEKFNTNKFDTYFKTIPNKELLDVPDGTVLPTRLNETTNPNGGKECAEYVNDIMGGVIPRLGNTYQDKLKVANEQYGKIGAAAVWNPANNDYGHAGVIIGEQGDKWIIKSSNLKGDGVVTTDLVPKNEIAGYRNIKDKKQLTGSKNYNSVEDYFRDTSSTKNKRISKEQANKIIKDDFGNLKLKLKESDLENMRKVGAISDDIINDYKYINTIKKTKDYTIDDDIEYFEETEDKDQARRRLVVAALTGLIDNDEYKEDGGFAFYDGDIYSSLEKLFDSTKVEDEIKIAKQKAEELKNKYNLQIK